MDKICILIMGMTRRLLPIEKEIQRNWKSPHRTNRILPCRTVDRVSGLAWHHDSNPSKKRDIHWIFHAHALSLFGLSTQTELEILGRILILPSQSQDTKIMCVSFEAYYWSVPFPSLDIYVVNTRLSKIYCATLHTFSILSRV